MRISDWSSDVCASDLINHCCLPGRNSTGAIRHRSIALSRLNGPHLRSLHVHGGLKVPPSCKATASPTRQPLRPEAGCQGQFLGSAAMSPAQPGHVGFNRSEEHTSELQSLMRISYAVFCLQKNKNNKIVHDN